MPSLVIPIMRHQDSIGPMARSVADAAALLTVIAGRDSLDNFTLAQPPSVSDYSDALQPFGLEGVRLGVVRSFMIGKKEYVDVALNDSIEVMRGLGTEVLEVDFVNAVDIMERAWEGEGLVAEIDFKVGIRYDQRVVADFHYCVLGYRKRSRRTSLDCWTFRPA